MAGQTRIVRETARSASDIFEGTSGELTVEGLKALALRAPDPLRAGIPVEAIRTALRIREVENTFLDLFSKGRMNGTVHTCVGQEFAAVAVAGQLESADWVSSNHRCHGHFIAKTGRWGALLDELMGLESGVCRGIGSSQHLFAPGFLSNGTQGSLVPVASGIALHQKRSGAGGITASFIGEGTFGEGVLYEAMNLASLWQLPQLFVCENNLYSQSTPQPLALSGTIAGRAAAFGMKYFEANTWDLAQLLVVARAAIDSVRNTSLPAVLNIRTYRLNAHSKSDDDRDTAEIAFFRDRDPLNRLLADESWQAVRQHLRAEIDVHLQAAVDTAIDLDAYVTDQLPRAVTEERRPIANEKIRLVHALNRAYAELVEAGALFIGEDIHDPYGGAFKVSKGIGQRFPTHVLTTPISEAGIVGVGAGLALMGERAFVEIMFGDFTANIFDQLINNISKFHHMYAGQACVPVRIRTPMGGKRGYGPTHSQSLEKFLLGIDNVALVALSSLEDPAQTLRETHALPGPAVIIENKVDYGKLLWQGSSDYRTEKWGGGFGTLVLSPLQREPTLTLVAYGETARELAEGLKDIFFEADEVVELLVPILLHPLDLAPIRNSALRTGRVLVVEDGSVHGGIGAEIIATLVESHPGVRCARLGAAPVPIPSVLALERRVLPSTANVIQKIRSMDMGA